MADIDWTCQLAEQLDRHWRGQLRPRLAAMTDAEYRWEPVPGAWNVRPRGTSSAPITVGAGEFTVDFAMPAPDPAPVTTIAWRLGHIVVGVLGMRVASHFGGPPMDYSSHRYPGDAASALEQLDTVYTTVPRSRCCATCMCGTSERPHERGPCTIFMTNGA